MWSTRNITCINAYRFSVGKPEGTQLDSSLFYTQISPLHNTSPPMSFIPILHNLLCPYLPKPIPAYYSLTTLQSHVPISSETHVINYRLVHHRIKEDFNFKDIIKLDLNS